MTTKAFHQVDGWVAIESWKIENLQDFKEGDFISPFFTMEHSIIFQKVLPMKSGALKIERISPAYVFFKIDEVYEENKNG